jgi:hypothetical protein
MWPEIKWWLARLAWMSLGAAIGWLICALLCLGAQNDRRKGP